MVMMNYDHGEEGDCVGGDVRDNHDDNWGMRKIKMMVNILMIRMMCEEKTCKKELWQKVKKKALFEEEKEAPLNIFFVG